MSRRLSEGTGVAAIVARIPRVDASAVIAAGFRSQIDSFERLPEVSQADILTGVQRNLERWWRWLSTGEEPPDEDYEPLREWARARATEGVRLEDLLRSLHLGAQLGWKLLRSYARRDEADALIAAAGLLMRYIDRLSTVVATTYLAERDVLVSEDERRTRHLLDLLTSEPSPDAAEMELAHRLGVPVAPAYTPFVIVVPGQPPRFHAELASRLRRRGWKLAITEGDRVVGLAWTPLELVDIDTGPGALLVVGDATPRPDLAQARADLDVLTAHARRKQLRGRLAADEHALEIIVGRSPRLAATLRARVIGPLADPEHAELLATLRMFLAHHLDRSATAAALHIHRNTLAYRIDRIQELSGVDITSPRDLALLHLALGVDAPSATA